jgi:hypothetical protein
LPLGKGQLAAEEYIGAIPSGDQADLADGAYLIFESPLAIRVKAMLVAVNASFTSGIFAWAANRDPVPAS